VVGSIMTVVMMWRALKEAVPETHSPMTHQIEFVGTVIARDTVRRTMQRRGHPRPIVSGGLLADEMGTGKTLSIILAVVAGSSKWAPPDVEDAADVDAGPRDNGKTLIIVPTSVVAQWVEVLISIKDMLNHTVIQTKNLRIMGRQGSYAILEEDDIVLVSSQLLQKTSSVEWALRDSRTGRSINWARVVIDEGHMIKDKSTATCQTAMQIQGESKWVVSATPVMNKMDELVTSLAWIGYRREDLATTDQVSRIAAACKTQRSCAEVGISLPELGYQHVKVLHSEDEVRIIDAIKQSGRKSMAVLQALRLASFSPQALYDSPTWKEYLQKSRRLARPSTQGVVLEALLAHINSLGRDQRAIVFTHYKPENDMICAALMAAGIRFERISGEESQDEKNSAQTSFQRGCARVIVMNSRCGSFGLNMQRASVVYFVSADYNPWIEMQGVARAHRVGQTDPVKAVFIKALTKAIGPEDDLDDDEDEDDEDDEEDEDGDGGDSKKNRSARLDIDTRIEAAQYQKMQMYATVIGPPPKNNIHLMRLQDGKRNVDKNDRATQARKAETAKAASEKRAEEVRAAREAAKVARAAKAEAAKAAKAANATNARKARVDRRASSSAAPAERKKKRAASPAPAADNKKARKGSSKADKAPKAPKAYKASDSNSTVDIAVHHATASSSHR
jgi:transcription termination factor 2